MSGHPASARKSGKARHPSSARTAARGRIKAQRRIHIEAAILWPVLCTVSAIYLGFVGRVLGAW
jgi:hypothetical protein